MNRIDSLSRRPRPKRPPTDTNILLVHAHPGFRATMGVALGRSFSLRTAATASQALRWLRSSVPDLVLLGTHLHDVETSYFVRVLHAKAETCHIVLLNDPAGDFGRVRAEDVAGFVTAPLYLDQLADEITLLTGAPVQPRFSRRISRVVEHIGHHYMTIIRNDLLAELAGVSSTHLAHVFRIETGFSIHEYVARVRIEVAKEFLASTGEKLDAVAALVGFCDGPHLSKAFARHAGMRPGAYRRRSDLVHDAPVAS